MTWTTHLPPYPTAGITRREFAHLTLAAGTLLLAPAGAAQAAVDWVDRRQLGPFVCVADFPLTEYEVLLGQLAPLEQELRRVLGLAPMRTPVYLHLLSSQARHRALLATHYPQVPYRRALYIQRQGQACVFAFRSEELATDVRHECTHAVLHADLPMVPLWLDEGLAEYFEVKATERASQHPHLRAMRWDLRLGMVTEIAELETRQTLPDLSGRDYRHAWAWTHFMLHGPPAAHATLVAYLNDIRRHEAPGQLSQRLATALPNLPEQLKQHFRTTPRS